MAITIEPQLGSGTSHHTVLVTWGLTTEELARRIEQLGLTDAGVHAEVIADDPRGMRLRLCAPDHGRLEWGAAIVRAGLGDVVVGGDGATLEGSVVELLSRHGLTAATAESLTSGLLASRLCEPPGAAEVFHGGVVSYTSEAKFRVLDVPEGPVVSADAAMAMARGAAMVLGVDAAVSLTGVAGPAEMEGKPVGTVYVGTWLDGEARAVGLLLPGDREAIRQAAASHGLDQLRHRLLNREHGLAIRL